MELSFEDPRAVGLRGRVVRNQLRGAAPEAFALAEEAVSIAFRLEPAASGLDEAHASASTSFRRVLHSAEGAIAAAELGLEGETLVLLQGLLGALVRLKMHREDPEFSCEGELRPQGPSQGLAVAIENSLSRSSSAFERDEREVERIRGELEERDASEPQTRSLAERADRLERERLLALGEDAPPALPLSFTVLTVDHLASQVRGAGQTVDVDRLSFYLLEIVQLVEYAAHYLKAIFGDEVDPTRLSALSDARVHLLLELAEPEPEPEPVYSNGDGHTLEMENVVIACLGTMLCAGTVLALLSIVAS